VRRGNLDDAEVHLNLNWDFGVVSYIELDSSTERCEKGVGRNDHDGAKDSDA
jgi:hypothetical protein